jgi:hypothetical protein
MDRGGRTLTGCGENIARAAPMLACVTRPHVGGVCGKHREREGQDQARVCKKKPKTIHQKAAGSGTLNRSRGTETSKCRGFHLKRKRDRLRLEFRRLGAGGEVHFIVHNTPVPRRAHWALAGSGGVPLPVGAASDMAIGHPFVQRLLLAGGAIRRPSLVLIPLLGCASHFARSVKKLPVGQASGAPAKTVRLPRGQA